MTARLQNKYQTEMIPRLKEQLARTNLLSLPRIEKIVVSMGVGDAINEKKYLDEAVDAMRLITGQQPIVTKARKSIAGFRLREGMSVGCKVTLRRRRMYEFLDRLISAALPRIRDFRGIESKMDGRGNYTLGVPEQIVFPEIILDRVNKINGMNITFVTSAETDEEGFALLKHLGLPFKNVKKN